MLAPVGLPVLVLVLKSLVTGVFVYYIIFIFGKNIFGLPESCQSLSSLRARIFDGSHTCLWGGSCNARLRLSVEFVTDMVPGDVE